MEGMKFTALCGPRGAELKYFAVESIALTASQSTASRILVINADASFAPSVREGKAAKDGLARLSSVKRWLGMPFIPSGGLQAFLSETGRKDALGDFDGYRVLVICDQAAMPGIIGLLDQALFLVPADPSAGPWLFPIIKAMGRKALSMNTGVVLLGETRIEAAAEAFVGIKKDLTETLGGDPGLAFLGFMGFDPERLSLATASGAPLVGLFQGQEEHGQAMAVCRSVLSEDDARGIGEFSCLLEKIKEITSPENPG
jgi:hypothetical protein